MVDVTINDLSAATIVAPTDELEIQKTAGGASEKVTVSQLQQFSVTGGFKNKIINGDFRVNQRDAVAHGAIGVYGYDRWKGHASGIEQIIEEGSFKPSVEHTLSGTNVTTAQITSPATGNWSIVVPANAVNIQVEEGAVVTSYELRHIQQELDMCERYFETAFKFADHYFGSGYSDTAGECKSSFARFTTEKRIAPTVIYDPFTSVLTAITDNTHTSLTGSGAFITFKRVFTFIVSDAAIVQGTGYSMVNGPTDITAWFDAEL